MAKREDVRDAQKGWTVNIIDNSHNHPLIPSTAYPEMRRLTLEQVKHCEDQFKIFSKTSSILASLRSTFPDVLATTQDVANLRNKWKRDQQKGSTDAENVLGMLDELPSSAVYRAFLTDQGRLVGLLITSRTALAITDQFPTVLVADCTYKTNAYRLPLLQLVGMTAENQTFTSAAILVLNETRDWYELALAAYRDVMGPVVKPDVIVTDRDNQLIAAVRSIYPDAKQMLCSWHLSKNLVAKGKAGVPQDKWEAFERDWRRYLVSARTVNELDEGIINFERLYAHVPVLKAAYQYAIELLELKEYFVHAYTNSFLHFGQRDTS